LLVAPETLLERRKSFPRPVLLTISFGDVGRVDDCTDNGAGLPLSLRDSLGGSQISEAWLSPNYYWREGEVKSDSLHKLNVLQH
jgi:hypothetical protein